MPIFEYRCEECGFVSEFLSGVAVEEPALACKNCGSAKLTRLMSAHHVGKRRQGGQEGDACCGKPGVEDCIPGSCCGRYTIGEKNTFTIK